MSPIEFDRFATSYERDLAKSLAITGEGRNFYAQQRIDWTAAQIARLQVRVQKIMDYGCGDGANVPMLARRFEAGVLGVDVSTASLALAGQSNAGPGISFLSLAQWKPNGSIDLAFCNGVFHHIAPGERAACLAAIRDALTPAGLFAFWENNPWNPGTRYVMSQCAFDANATPISPHAARKILSQAGFRILRTDSLFYFPRSLALLRPVERCLRALPFGGQYLVLCQNRYDA
jgi:trans-aconitate methyltransferase